MRSFKKFLLFSLSFSALAIASADAQSEKTLVVVTPLKANRPIDQVPMSVTRITGGALNRAAAQSVDDIVRDIPNVDSAGGPRNSSEEPSIRGLSDRRIVIKVDGIRRNFRAQYGGRYFIDPWMIESAEIVRGGNSAIDGSGAVGGVIQFFTPNARDELSGSKKNWGVTARAGYQSADTQKSEMLAGYATEGAFDAYAAQSFRTSGSVRTGDGKSLSPGQSIPRNVLAKLGYNFSPSHRLEVRAAQYHETADMPVSPFQPVSTTNSATTRQSEVKDISARYRLAPQSEELSNIFDITAVLYHSIYNIDTRRKSDGRFDETDFKTTGFDIYNTSSIDFGGSPTKLTFGTEYYQNEQSGKRNGGFRPLLGDGKDKNLGIYAQYELPLPFGLTLIPAARYDHYELKPGDAALIENVEDQISPKIGANWQFTDSFSGFMSMGKSFRTPTLTELYATGTIFPGNTLISNPNLQPEKAFSKEIGVRYKLGDALYTGDHFSMSASLFENEIDDYIEQIVGSTTTQFRNVTEAKLKGVETEMRYALNGWVAKVSYGTVSGKNITLDEPLSDVPAAKFVGKLERDVFEDRSVKLGTRFTHYAGQKKVPPAQLITSSSPANTLDVYATWLPSDPALAGLSVNVGVDNLFDNNYRRYLAFVPEAGRNMKVDVTWKF